MGSDDEPHFSATSYLYPKLSGIFAEPEDSAPMMTDPINYQEVM